MYISIKELVEQEPSEFLIVGAGPVGIALAMALANAERHVVIVESGLANPDNFGAALTSGHKVDPLRHGAPEIVMARSLGGTSKWWGGRCVPLDDVDFSSRPRVAARWPIPHSELAKWYEGAAAFFGIGNSEFVVANADVQDSPVRFDTLERWAPDIDCSRVHAKTLEQSSHIQIVLGVTATNLIYDNAGVRVGAIEVAGRDGNRYIVQSRTVILACGGLESTRLLMVAEGLRSGGVQSPALGLYYMGHLSGKIADIVLADAADVRRHDFFRDGGAFARRRFSLSLSTIQKYDLLNIAFWADNPPFYAASHRSGVLSLVWAVFAIPPLGRLLVSEGVRRSHVGPEPRQWLAHFRNVLFSPIDTVKSIVDVLHDRFLAQPRKPGFLVHNQSGQYALHFHAEQSPTSASKVRLSERVDTFGMPLLDIDLKYDPADAEAIVTAHEILDRELRSSGHGRLDFYEADRPARLRSVMEQAADGFHQTGTTRMGEEPEDSVVDAQCRVHGIENLYLVAGSVFPTSGQANPTFATVALALRLAATLISLPASTETQQ